MAKYDSVLADLKTKLASSQRVLIALPNEVSVDKLSGALALYLTLSNSGKQAFLVTEAPTQVSAANLFGIDRVQNSLPQTSGDLIITLSGVVAQDGTVPDIEKLDYFPEGGDMKLVFKVLPGHTFKPSSITPTYSGGDLDLILTVGARDFNSLGGIYQSQVFSGVTLINLDKDPTNTQYGTLNIIDPESTSVSEMVYQLILGLGLTLDPDSATNLLEGIYDVTSNLTSNVKPETLITSASLMQSGGKLPQSQRAASPATPLPEQGTPAQSYAQNFPPLNQVFGFPVTPASDKAFTNPPVSQNEERPMGEVATSANPETQSPEPDWLTPKIFSGKGGNIG